MKCAKLSPLLIVLLWLAGCAAPSTPIPTLAVPSPQPLRIQADALFAPLYGLMAGCVPAGSALYYASVQEPADARLGWGDLPVPANFTHTLGTQKAVVVVNPQNQLQTLSTQQVRAIYAATLRSWPPSAQLTQPMMVWSYPIGSEMTGVLQYLLGPETLLSSQINITAGSASLREAISKDHGAVGILPHWWLDTTVKALTIEGETASDWTRPILAGTSIEPQGTLKAWLLCLQEGLKAH
jgi:hypothetical protein